jgi:hypothetical protein
MERLARCDPPDSKSSSSITSFFAASAPPLSPGLAQTKPGQRTDLVRDETVPAQQPEERHGKQGADDHRQPCKKADLLLMPGQHWLSPASGLVCHNSPDYTGSRHIGHGVFTPPAELTQPPSFWE